MKIKFFQKIIDFIRRKKTYSNIVNFGKDNKICYKQNKNNKDLKIFVNGNNNEIIIDTQEYFKADIIVGTLDCAVNNCRVYIGSKTTSNGLYAILLEDNSFFEIGEDSMLSDNIRIYCSDTHCITNKEGDLLNYSKGVKVGNHVWIGYNSIICKNSVIPDNSIIGAGSVVAKVFKEENTVIAGNPAETVKKNVNWNRQRPNLYKKDK